MIGCGSGFVGGMKGMALSVLYIVGVTVRKSKPRRPSPRCDTTDDALVLIFWCTGLIVSYTGCPMIGLMVGCEKVSLILSTVVMMALSPC